MKPINILLIEDNPGDIELVREGFRQAKVTNEIRVITDGQIAWDFFDQLQPDNLPDIVLLDINLPKVDGIEILQKIRASEISHNIPVIILTSSEADEDVTRSYDERVNSYVTKPVDFAKFLTVIQSVEDFWLSVVKLPTKN
ncbi:response regulator [Gynuella sp.]|uniref:response regulator n=1 Tax=Gynuella sp. TaxID=2969146 RepID=UPI003D0AC519